MSEDVVPQEKSKDFGKYVVLSANDLRQLDFTPCPNLETGQKAAIQLAQSTGTAVLLKVDLVMEAEQKVWAKTSSGDTLVLSEADGNLTKVRTRKKRSDAGIKRGPRKAGSSTEGDPGVTEEALSQDIPLNARCFNDGRFPVKEVDPIEGKRRFLCVDCATKYDAATNAA